MEMKTSLQRMDMKCSVCKQTLNEPNSLQCSHQFCNSCFNQMQPFQQGGKTGTYCPICKKFTTVSSMRSSQSSDELYINLHGCNLNKEKYSNQCLKHPQNNLKHTCTTCNMIVCDYCKDTYHRGHKTELFDKTFAKMLPHIKANVETLKHHQNVLEQNISEIESARTNCMFTCNRTKNDIIRHKEALIAKLEADSHKLIDIIDNEKTQKESRIDEIISELLQQKAMEDSLISYADDILGDKKTPNPSQALQEGLFINIETYVNESATPKNITVEVPSINFLPGHIPESENMTGKLDIELHKLLIRSEMGHSAGKAPKTLHQDIGNLQDDYLQPCGDRYTPESSVTSYSQDVNLEYDYLFPTAKARETNRYTSPLPLPLEQPAPPVALPHKSFRTTDINLQSLLTRKFTKYHDSFVLRKDVARVCFYENQFWCPCFKENCIDVYTIEGKLVKSINLQDINGPRSLHPYRRNEFVVAAKTGLFVIADEGKILLKLLRGYIRDVYVNGHKIIALKKKSDESIQDEVHIFNSKIWPPVDEKVFSVAKNAVQRVLVTNQSIFISFHDPRYASYIIQYSLSGEKISHIGNHGNKKINELDGPILCAVGHKETILIADSNNKQLKLFNTDLQWSILKVKVSDTIMDAGFLESKCLWVLCLDEAKHQYKIKTFKF